ncbi:UNVERIFIED_CONTAM: Valine--tRNA ligase, mitochondrial 1 [Sesamum angustifolium]|uniref:valine--tRNA ligase n=1 Tax=Sesamum angustifolium TaxID=2727405 RepID=A0AAW2MRI8_9LAMI
MDWRELTPEEFEKKKKKEEKAREKELKKIKAAQKAVAAKLQAQQPATTTKSEKKKNAKRETEEENPEDYADPETPFGEKKKLSRQMAKTYNPNAVESSWYEWWEKSNFFEADPKSSKPPFVIVLPPPNVTGALHIGHALTAAIQDTIIRWRRMSGYNTLWVPGMDHAGIATQVVMEKKLMREMKLTRHDVGRERFVAEVEHIEIKERTPLRVPGYEKPVEFGVLTSFAYPLEGGLGEIVVATTRVETMLGDTAIAMHPNDPRYSHVHGKFAVHPFNGRKLPIVCDAVLVDMNFGTGAVKITPAHDPNDFEVGKRHNLEFINIFTDDGKINSNGGPEFAGMPRFQARVAVTEALKEKGLYRGDKNNEMRLGICSRINDVVEPLIKPQWYVNCKSMAEQGLDAVINDTNQKMEIIPKQYVAEWQRWLENIRDWCISRQLWWGHRIPAWYAVLEDDELKEVGVYDKQWVVARNEEEAQKEASKKFSGKKFQLFQDPDVLDTWFSSGLFPLSVLVYLHPMIRDAHGRKMSKSLGNVIDPLEVINGVTLENLHKRLEQGNLDPNELKTAKEGQKKDFPKGIPECGADALRFALVSYTAQSDKINLDIQRVVGYHQWCNKLWNAIRFAMTKLGDDYSPPAEIVPAAMPFSCQWILSVLNKAISKTVASLDAYEFSDAATDVYSWWQFQLCDVFIEVIKPYFSGNSPAFASARKFAQDTLWLCLDYGLRLLHPFMPFVTEELWQRLPSKKDSVRKESIVISEYPSTVECWSNDDVESDMDMVESVVKSLRSLRSQLAPNDRHERRAAFVRCRTNDACDIIKKHELEIATLATLSSLDVLTESDDAPAGCKKKTSAPGYQEKVPAHIREVDEAKLASLFQELLSFKEASEHLERESSES